MPQTAATTQDRYSERMSAAKEMAQAIVATCLSYEQAASPVTVNRLLQQVELLADLAESLEVERTIRALDASGAAATCPGQHGANG